MATLNKSPYSGPARRGDKAQGGQVAHVLVDEGLIQVRHVLPLRVCCRTLAQLRRIIPATKQAAAHSTAFEEIPANPEHILHTVGSVACAC